jgi:hypothetical protein
MVRIEKSFRTVENTASVRIRTCQGGYLSSQSSQRHGEKLTDRKRKCNRCSFARCCLCRMAEKPRQLFRVEKAAGERGGVVTPPHTTPDGRADRGEPQNTDGFGYGLLVMHSGVCSIKSHLSCVREPPEPAKSSII